MTCREAENLLDAYFDGELDLRSAVEVEAHLADCARCSAALRRREAVRRGLQSANLSLSAPSRLRARLSESGGFPLQVRPRPWTWVIPMAALAAVALGLIGPTRWSRRGEGPLAEELLSDHLRSLQASHLMDVASTDKHTVRPWFAGKVDYAPPVPDLSAEGFPLIGGRLDYVGERPVAALVYRLGGHVVNLFIWPHAAQDTALTLRGYHLVGWSQGPFACWAVSDAADAELRRFGAVWRQKARE